MGPVLFIIYINDISTAVRCKHLLYAYDSALLYSGKTTHLIKERLYSDLEAHRERLIIQNSVPASRENRINPFLGQNVNVILVVPPRRNVLVPH